MKCYWDFLSGLIGALLGGLTTLLASWWQHHLEKKRNEIENNKSINATIEAIKTELVCLLERYDQTIGKLVETLKDNESFLYYYYATEDYFTIYNQNSSLIGQISDACLRKNIISVYINIKGLLETYKINNGLIDKYQYYKNLFLETENKIYEQQRQAYHTSLLDYFPYIKEGHDQTKVLGTQLIRDITVYLDSQEVFK